MRIIKKILLGISILSLSTSCGFNLFEAASTKDSDAALLYEAEKLIDEQDYLSAITELSAISAEYGTNYKVRRAFASAYAGACGMEFFAFFTDLSSFDGSSTLFKFMMNAFTDKATTPSYCRLAENKIKELGLTDVARAAAAGTAEPNFFMAVLAMAKIGSVLRTNLDLDGVNSLGDGTPDAGADYCTPSATTPALEDTEVLEVATGFGLLIENLDDLLGGTSDAATAMDAISLVITGGLCANGTVDKCVIRDESAYTALTAGEQTELLDTYRDLLANSATGLGAVVCAADACCP